jgi:hypothetical protein
MMADDPKCRPEDRKPLALRTAVVRQLASSRFRPRVRQAMDRTALVIGNPSVEGFAAAFPGPKSRPYGPPPDLPNAQAESEAVATVLRGVGYTVTAVPEQSRAADVMGKLYAQAYRVLHISAHGVFDLRHVDGRRRSGVVLSDGLLITAAEIEAMETVPELVFLNCCHLGQVNDPTVRGGNKLAASVARELIQIGVRCVVVAGWAVNDQWARVFGEAFYQELMLKRRTFGDAVFQARQTAWRANSADVTWGAFQAYGDPGWLAEPRAEEGAGLGQDGSFASPDELLDKLARIRAEFSRRRDLQSEREVRTLVESVTDLLAKRCPPAWLDLPEVQSALGAAWRDLGRFEDARTAFLAAIQAEDLAGRVPIKDIEQLANIEARLGERLEAQRLAAARNAPVDGVQAPEAAESPEALINLAIQRLETLDQLVSASGRPEDVGSTNPERAALLGSAWKRKASLYARRLLAGEPGPPAKGNRDEMLSALEASAEAYRRAEADPANHRFRPYNALNRLALKALLPASAASERAAAVALARQCRQAAAQSFARRPDFWNAVMQAEAVLVEHLVDGGLGKPGEVGQSALDEVVAAYENALSNVTAKPSQIDSVATQMDLLSTFYDALAIDAGEGAASADRIAARLLELINRIHPGRPVRQRAAAPPTATSRKSRRGPPTARPKSPAGAKKGRSRKSEPEP